MPTIPTDPLVRLMAKVVKESGGCWIWHGATKNGYAHVGEGQGWHYGHRLSYERHVGPIPPGFRVHHRCETPACVNPDHLEPVSAAEHAQEHGLGLPQCRTCGSSDWYRRPDGQRRCRGCRRERRAQPDHPCPVCGGPARTEATTCGNSCGTTLYFTLKGKVEHQHGTYQRYKTNKCRCPECRAANTQHERARRQRLPT